MSFELDLDMPFAARMHTPTFARLPPGASHLPHSHLPPTHPGVKNATDVEASLPSLLRTIGPSLGLSPSPSPASVGEGRGFFSANTPFVLLYAVLLLCLAWRRLRGTSAPARQVWFVPFFALARVLFFALGWRVPHAQARAGLHGAAGRWQYGSGQGYGHKHVGGMGEQVATAAAEELGTFAGWVRGAALLGSLGGMYYTAMRLFSDGMACYHPSNSIAFGLLKIWPTTAVPIAALTTALGLAVPSLTTTAIASRAPWAARWAHTLSLDAVLLSCAVLIVQLLAILIAWACEPSNFRLTPGTHYDDVKEKSKLLALTMMTVALTLPALYRCAAFFFDGRYAWLHSSGAFYTLFCLPEALCICLFVILPLKLVIPDPRTLMRVEIPDEDLDIEGGTQLEMDEDEDEPSVRPHPHPQAEAEGQEQGTAGGSSTAAAALRTPLPASPAPRRGMEMASAYVPVLPASASAVLPIVGRS